VTLLSGGFLLAVFACVQFEVWRTLIGGGSASAMRRESCDDDGTPTGGRD